MYRRCLAPPVLRCSVLGVVYRHHFRWGQPASWARNFPAVFGIKGNRHGGIKALNVYTLSPVASGGFFPRISVIAEMSATFSRSSRSVNRRPVS